MTIYYSPSAAAFFDDRVHGTRTLFVTDEDALRAELAQITEREDPLLAAPEGESDDERTARCNQLAMIEAARADLLSNPPVRLIPNPDCRVPGDAEEVSAEEHAALMENQARGFMIVWDAELGTPVARMRPMDRDARVRGLKKERDRLLRDSDWTQMPDNELSKAERKRWADWRQAVRDTCRQVEAEPVVAPDGWVFPPAPNAEAPAEAESQEGNA